MTTTLSQEVTSIEQILAGFGDGVSIMAVNITSLLCTNRVEPSTKEGKAVRVTKSYVDVVTDISLDYDAGYQVHFTASFESERVNTGKNNHLAIDGVNQFMKEQKDKLYFSMANQNIDLAACENITLTIQNPAILSYLEDNRMIYECEPADESFDMGTGLNVEVSIEDDVAVCFTNEIQAQLAYKEDMSHTALIPKEHTLPEGFSDKIALRVRDKVAELLAIEEV